MSVRARVALAFAVSAAVVLGALGTFLYVRVHDDLTETVDRGLIARADELGAAVRPTSGALEADERPAQVLLPDGTVVASSAGAERPLLTTAQLADAQRGPIVLDRPGDAVLDEGVRLRAGPAGAGRVAVVGASLDERDEALRSLLITEVVGFALALALISAAGYAISGLVLRPEREALARERRFVADASHELRTPLTTLRSELEVALVEEPSIGGLQRAVRSAGDEAERLTRLTQDLLVLAQADERALPIRTESVDVPALLRAVADGREARVRVADGLVMNADRLRLEQALANLVDNAVRHGGAPVELAAVEDGDSVILTVRDHGAGLSPDFTEHAFERFARADPGRSGGGTGLGLAIVRAIAEAHGGTATLSAADPGTIATLRLPHRPLMDGLPASPS